ncbi:alpha/beta hydrolase [Microbacterium sp. RD1]|uniref:alpha/beta hydrolase n=1 Tax=Microbacterium sp. RD1 TaxID=3457313 RepID=UPI003FA57EB4
MTTTQNPPTPSENALKLRAALRRAMSVTRMLDYGMDYWDATHLFHAPPSTPWHEVAEALAAAQSERAHAAAHRGDVETAVACHRRATAALYFAQLAFNDDQQVKRTLYTRLSGEYARAAALDTTLDVERLSIPFRQSALVAWLVRTPESPTSPPVVIVGGQSGWGPAYHRQAEALARRGLTAVLLEAPGQGETRMMGGLHLDHGVDRAFSATLDVVAERTGYTGPAGVWGNSFGGLLAARAAVHDPRFAACCVNGAIATPMPLPYRAAREQTHALLGVDDDESAARILRELWLEPPLDRTRAAVLVLHGGADPLVTREQQEVFLDLSAHSSMRIWDDGEHTMYNHSAERTDVVGDWFRAQLLAR